MKITQPPLSNLSDITIDGDLDMGTYFITTGLKLSNLTIDADKAMGGYGFSGLGNLTLNKNAGLQMLAALATNGDWSGETVLATAGENLSQFDVVYLKNDGKVYQSKADSESTMPIKGIAVAEVGINDSGVFLIEGFIRQDAWNWGIGDLLYASRGTSGSLQGNAPITSGDQVQRVGIAVTADIIWFRPDLTVLGVT